MQRAEPSVRLTTRRVLLPAQRPGAGRNEISSQGWQWGVSELNADISEEQGSPPQEGWFSRENRTRIDDLIAKLQTSNTQEGVSRYHAMAEGYLLGLLDCFHVSAEHHDSVRQYLHNLAIARLKKVKPKGGK